MGLREMRQWAEALEPAALFDLDEVQAIFPAMSRSAVVSCLSRLCQGDDPLMGRPKRGWYCRRRLGTFRRVPVPHDVYPELAWRVAGPGAGMAGPFVANVIDWSTQVSPRWWIAVVGRPPRSPGGLVYLGRSNRRRLELVGFEVSMLEAIRDFDTWSELEWAEALDRYANYASRGWLGPLRPDLFVDVADAERGRGPLFRRRCRELAAIAGSSG